MSKWLLILRVSFCYHFQILGFLINLTSAHSALNERWTLIKPIVCSSKVVQIVQGLVKLLPVNLSKASQLVIRKPKSCGSIKVSDSSEIITSAFWRWICCSWVTAITLMVVEGRVEDVFLAVAAPFVCNSALEGPLEIFLSGLFARNRIENMIVLWVKF